MIYWLNFLHFYQPPTTSDDVIDEVVKSSYQSWLKFLNKYKNVKVTVNFTACLTERLHIAGYEKLLKDFAKIAERGQIEFTGSAAFHPILPLLPDKEIIKQIEINHQINKLRFGKIYKPQGFFLPEMAYSEKVAKIIKKLGYKYIILDQIALNGSLDNQIDNSIKYKIKKNDLDVVFRHREVSQTFVPETIINILEGRLDNFRVVPRIVLRSSAVKSQLAASNQYIITATDGELYGHHYWNWWPAYSYLIAPRGVSRSPDLSAGLSAVALAKEGALAEEEVSSRSPEVSSPREFTIKTLTISEYLKSLKKQKAIYPLASSWESTSDELKKNIPYAVWNDPKNKIHKLLWQLADFVLKLNWESEDDPNHFSSRLHLEKGLASCTFWWASGKDFKLFSPHAWQTSMVEVGAHELLNSIRSLEDINHKHKLKAEKIFSQIRDLIWHKHWKK